MNRILSILLFMSSGLISAGAATITEPASGLNVSLGADGSYFVSIQNSDWFFGGKVAGPIQWLRSVSGADGIGAYDEITFQFSESGILKQGGIRAYQQKPAVLFTLQFVTAGSNGAAFPSLVQHPAGLYRLTNSGWQQHFDQTTTCWPLVEFDAKAHAFIISPASDFMVSSTSIGPDQSIASGISSQMSSLPSGFRHRTLLVVEQGINRAFETWGQALTDLQGKVRPPNNADIMLSHLGYWTDNGSRYYYRFDRKVGYETTLTRVRDEFVAKGLALGYMQLDSWFYPKGDGGSWAATTEGIYMYEAASQLFDRGLKGFQELLGLPLVTHGRWIDEASPYRQAFRMSNNVSVDPLYWNQIMSGLKDAGVTTYEQDWLAVYAQTDFNLSDPDLFLDGMAAAAAQNGMTIQYCMPLSQHYLQTSKYNNVTTIRTSPDRFGQSRWDRFLYGSRLASALGVWPWSDVFMSGETDNLLLATLSAGPVGVGDQSGSVDAANLLHAVRQDGLIVKPDAPLVPTDSTVIQDAQGMQGPMIAATYTDFGLVKAVYVIAHPRTTDLAILFQPSSFGLSGPVYVYNYFTGAGQVLRSNDTFADRISGGLTYYIMVSIGPSGIGLLGDLGHFVPLGRQRVNSVIDNGVVEMEVAFAPGEKSRVITGYAAKAPMVTTKTGAVSSFAFHSETQLFEFSVRPGDAGTATVEIAGN